MAPTNYAQAGTFQNDGQNNDFVHYTNSTGGVVYSINSAGNNNVAGGLTLAGQGQPAILYATSLTAQAFGVFNTAAAVTMLAASAPAGTYRVSIYLVITTTFVTNTAVTMSIGFTDDDQAQTVTTTGGALTAGTILQNTYTFRSNGTAAITYTPSKTGSAATAGAAAFSVVLERLV